MESGNIAPQTTHRVFSPLNNLYNSKTSLPQPTKTLQRKLCSGHRHVLVLSGSSPNIAGASTELQKPQNRESPKAGSNPPPLAGIGQSENPLAHLRPLAVLEFSGAWFFRKKIDLLLLSVSDLAPETLSLITLHSPASSLAVSQLA